MSVVGGCVTQLTMSDSKDGARRRFYLFHHLDAIIDARSHGLLAEDVVPLLRERRDELGVEVVLSERAYQQAAWHGMDIDRERCEFAHRFTHQDADEDGIGDPALGVEVFPVGELHVLGDSAAARQHYLAEWETGDRAPTHLCARDITLRRCGRGSATAMTLANSGCSSAYDAYTWHGCQRRAARSASQ